MANQQCLTTAHTDNDLLNRKLSQVFTSTLDSRGLFTGKTSQRTDSIVFVLLSDKGVNLRHCVTDFTLDSTLRQQVRPAEVYLFGRVIHQLGLLADFPHTSQQHISGRCANTGMPCYRGTELFEGINATIKLHHDFTLDGIIEDNHVVIDVTDNHRHNLNEGWVGGCVGSTNSSVRWDVLIDAGVDDIAMVSDIQMVTNH